MIYCQHAPIDSTTFLLKRKLESVSFFLPQWQMQINTPSSSPSMSLGKIKFSCGSSNSSHSFSYPTARRAIRQFAGRHGHSNVTSNDTVFHTQAHQKASQYCLLSSIIKKANSVGVLLCFLPMAEQKNSILRTILEAEQGIIVVNSRKELKLEATHKTDKMILQKKNQTHFPSKSIYSNITSKS